MKCRFEHDGDCCNSGATQYMCKCKQPCDTIIQITNADHIRAMTDEELANYFSMFERNIETDVFTSLDSKIWLDWLKRPAE